MKTADLKSEVIWDWMRPEMASIQATASLEEAVSEMKKFAIHHLIVLDGKKFVGLLDARDCAGEWDKYRPAASLMRSDVPLVDEQTDIRKAVELVVSRNLTALPLKRNGEVHGIITTTDLLRLLEAHVSRRFDISEFVEKGKEFLATPVMQTLSRLLGNAGF